MTMFEGDFVCAGCEGIYKNNIATKVTIDGAGYHSTECWEDVLTLEDAGRLRDQETPITVHNLRRFLGDAYDEAELETRLERLTDAGELTRVPFSAGFEDKWDIEYTIYV
jgi:hypothetical protein